MRLPFPWIRPDPHGLASPPPGETPPGEITQDALDRATAAASPFFNEAWYLAANADVRAAGVDPVGHYIQHGWREGRDPGPDFWTSGYLATNSDVAAAGLNPLLHWERWGRDEGRQQPRRPWSPQVSDWWTADVLASPSAQDVRRHNPLVSVIMPTRDRWQMLPAAIDSVLAQTWTNWELLIIDDGSSDGTAEAVRAAYADPRVTVIATKARGVSHARNTGLAEARGAYFAYLDSDNTWSPDFLELSLISMARAGAKSSYAMLRMNYAEKNAPEDIRVLGKYFNLDDLKYENFIDMNIYMHDRSLLDRCGMFDVSLLRMVDWDLVLRHAKSEEPVFCRFIGAEYDARPRPDRIRYREPVNYQGVIRAKHLLDWPAVQADLPRRDPDLVSIIICVLNNPVLTEACLQALFRHEAGLPFELVIVDNGSDPETAELLAGWAAREPRIRLVTNPVNLNFALGNNLGFAASRGGRVVFLNNDTEVTPEWLRALLAPLADPLVMGVQAKLLFPDGTIQGAGLVFPAEAPFAYHLYTGEPGHHPPTSRQRRFPAITGACMGLRASDFAAACGFDPIFVNGQEDVDLCLRLGGGSNVFACAVDSIVIHYEGRSAGRYKHVTANRRFFHTRWQGRVPATDEAFYAEDGLATPVRLPDGLKNTEPDLAVWRPLPPQPVPHPAAPRGRGLLAGGVRLCVPCPSADRKDQWGDYHFAVALCAALARQGIRSRLAFLSDWHLPTAPGEVNLVLRGLSNFRPEAARGNIIWLISHSEAPSLDELAAFDLVLVASDRWAQHLRTALPGTRVETLLQCTDAARFYPRPAAPERRHDRLYVANSRKVRRSTIAKALAEGVDLSVFGTGWEGIIPADWLKAANLPNTELPQYYASAGVVINDHWPRMAEDGFVSNRIFDALACAAPLITDRVAGMPPEVAAGCTFVEADGNLGDALARATAAADADGEAVARRQRAEQIRTLHSFDARVARLLEILDSLPDGLPGGLDPA